MNTVLYFEIQATEPEKLVTFYMSVFGWKCEKQEGMPILYYRITTDGHQQGGLLQRPTKTPPQGYGTNAYTCSIEVADYDATAKAILEHGGTIALPKFAVPGKCWQGYFLDPDNNTFGIFQVDENAR